MYTVYMHKTYDQCRTAFLLGCLFWLAACGTTPTASQTRDAGQYQSIKQDDGISTLAFTTMGAVSGTYTLHTTQTISKLRHGHKEFTIDIVDSNKTAFLVFYGYHGPGRYTLTNRDNGGEVHISLGSEQTTWDLAMAPTASCSLTISSDIPIAATDMDRMQGSFSCPHLPPATPSGHAWPIDIKNGHFTVCIIVES